ncbi:PTS sugar transporter subunit IIB [Bombilactobacillus mellis]|uniref:PTS sugar transporter subunit IIB n=1 Tax=Bombilactobacillus mellis TaxID=1218508 RepID=UPI0015807B02|nr:PTS lactose transporter subunit IIBC [Bombilactobacillus mellis]MCT6888719.1 hypothetical protein [Lactobacillus sp.]NUF24880.1 PTS lactose transporter subunit IIBC [Bombilactobacillus mellis]NUG66692.1 PTS lactose transporter subunit IIBC [Bombilactobacillus mellis]
MKILLICGNGISSGIIAQHIAQEGRKKGIANMEASAYSYAELPEVIDQFDAVLIGPQMKFNEAGIKKICDEYKKPFAFIDDMTYATLDGKKGLELAQKILGA